MTQTKQDKIAQSKNKSRHFLDVELKLLHSFFSKPKTYLFFIFLFLVIIFSILGLRLSHGVPDPFGYESVKNLHSAKEISTVSFLELFNGPKIDPTSVQPVNISVNLFTFLLSRVLVLPSILIVLINVLLALGSVLLFMIILKRNGISVMGRNIAILFILLSPIFIYYALSISVLPLASLVFMLSIYFLKFKRLRFISYILSIVVLTFGVKITLAYLIFILIFSIIQNRMKLFYSILVLEVFLIGVESYFHFPFSIFPFPLMTSQMIISEMVTDLGGLRGVGAMVLALFVFGFIRHIIQKQAFLLELTSVLLVIVSFFYEFRIFFFVNFLICLLASDSLTFLFNSKWYSEYLKAFGIFVVLCGILFTTVSYANRIADLEPTAVQLDALQWLSKQTPGVVFTIPEKASLLQTFADKTILIDESHYNYQINTDINTILYTRNLDETKEFLHKYNVSYIYIDSSVKQATWRQFDEGLLFTLRNKDTFKRIYDVAGVEIWEVMY